VVSKSLQELDAAAQTAILKAAEAKDAADRSRAEAEARRQERLEAHDRKVLADWDRQPLERDVLLAKRRLAQAIEADPTWQAIIDVIAAQSRLYQLFHEASGLSATYDRGPFTQHPPRVDEPGFDALAQIAERIASERVADEMDARDQERQAAGEGPTTPQEKTMSVDDIQHAHFCQPQPGEKEIRTETYPLDTDNGTVVISRCMECAEMHVTRLGKL